MKKLRYIAFTLSACILLSACSIDLPFLNSDADNETEQEAEDMSAPEPETEQEPISEAVVGPETVKEDEEAEGKTAEELSKDVEAEEAEADEAENAEDKEETAEDIPEEEFSLSEALGSKVKGELTSLGVTYRFYENGAEIFKIANDFAEIQEEIEYEGQIYPVISLQNVYPEAAEFRIPDHIKYIKDGAFRDSQIETVTIPDTIEYLSGFRTFKNCKNLRNIVFEGEFETDSNWNQTFMGCDNLETCTIPEGISETFETFNLCGNLTSVSLPDSLFIIGEETFSNCYSLEAVTIPVNVEIISNGAFYASGIKFMDIPENVKTVALSAFSRCGQMEELDMIDTADFKAAYLREMDSLKILKMSRKEDMEKIQTLDAPNLELVIFPDDIEEIKEDFFWSVEDKSNLTIQVPEKTVIYFQNKFPEINVVAKA